MLYKGVYKGLIQSGDLWDISHVNKKYYSYCLLFQNITLPLQNKINLQHLILFFYEATSQARLVASNSRNTHANRYARHVHRRARYRCFLYLQL